MKGVEEELVNADLNEANLEKLMVALAGDEEIKAFEREAEEGEEEDVVRSKLLVIGEAVVSGEFHGPGRMGRAALGVLDEDVVSGEFQGPGRIGKAGRATTDAMRKPVQYTSSIPGMVTCSLKRRL